MRRSCRRWSFISYFLITIIAFSAGFLFHRHLLRKWNSSIKSKTDDFHYMGEISDKAIYGLCFHTDPYGKEGKHYALKVDNDLVYWGTDSNLDGKIDEIKSFENSKPVFSSVDTNFDGVFDKRFVNTYKSNGEYDITMVDMNADNRFDLRIIHMPGAENETLEEAKLEFFFDGQWIEGMKNNKGFFVNIGGELHHIKFKDGNWSEEKRVS